MPLPSTMIPIATQTLVSAASSITFSSIPATYTDLTVVFNAGNSTAGQAFVFQVGNGALDTGNNYSYTYATGPGSSAAYSGRYANQAAGVIAWSSPATSIGDTGIVHLLNYSNSSTHKTVIARYSNSTTGVDMSVSAWRSTSSINTLKIYTTSGNILAGSTFTLYGIKAA